MPTTYYKRLQQQCMALKKEKYHNSPCNSKTDHLERIVENAMRQRVGIQTVQAVARGKGGRRATQTAVQQPRPATWDSLPPELHSMIFDKRSKAMRAETSRFFDISHAVNDYIKRFPDQRELLLTPWLRRGNHEILWWALEKVLQQRGDIIVGDLVYYGEPLDGGEEVYRPFYDVCVVHPKMFTRKAGGPLEEGIYQEYQDSLEELQEAFPNHHFEKALKQAYKFFIDHGYDVWEFPIR